MLTVSLGQIEQPCETPPPQGAYIGTQVHRYHTSLGVVRRSDAQQCSSDAWRRVARCPTSSVHTVHDTLEQNGQRRQRPFCDLHVNLQNGCRIQIVSTEYLLKMYCLTLVQMLFFCIFLIINFFASHLKCDHAYVTVYACIQMSVSMHKLFFLLLFKLDVWQRN